MNHAPRITPGALLACIALVLLALRPAAARLPESLSPHDLLFIYVHGFCENKEVVPFEAKMRDFLKPLPINAAVATFRYDRVAFDLTRFVHQWTQAKARADQAALELRRDLAALESRRTPYVLVGYSLGARVVAGALCTSPARLAHLRGVYLLGAALPHDYRFDARTLPAGMKIQSYFSSSFDEVLKIPFYNAEGKSAGGEVGFDDVSHVQNRRTVCTHVHKGGPLQRDYSNLAPVIGALALFREGVFIKGSPVKFNLALGVMSGSTHWNDVIDFDAKPHPLLIQQNAVTGHFRAVALGPGGDRTRLAWGASLHEVLREAGVFPAPCRQVISESTETVNVHQ